MKAYLPFGANKGLGLVLVFVIGILFIVSILAIGMMMLSLSQDFLSYSQKKTLICYYATVAQINWAALKLKESPYYSGGTSGDAIYPIAEAELIKIVVEPLSPPISPYEREWYRVKAYVRFKGFLGRKAIEHRIDATVVRNVEMVSPGVYNVSTIVKDWEEIKPPVEP